jgi:hypothetical protein
VQDQATEADFLKLAASQPGAASYEALQYKLAYPQFDLDYINQNLDEFRRQAKVDQVDWSRVAREHPTLKKYLRDPSTAGLAMDNSALLTAGERWLGKGSSYVDVGTPGKPDWRLGAGTDPSWLAALKNFGAASVYKFDTGLAAPFEVMAWASDKINDALGFPKTENSIFKQTAQYWQAKAAIWEPFSKRDYFGNSFKEDHWLTRGAAEVLKGTAEMGPLALLGGAAYKAGGHVGLLAFNTLYTAPDIYTQSKEITDSPGKAAFLTAVGAPLVGQAMSYTPLGSASGQALNQTIERGMARVAAEANPGFWRMARMWTAKVGVDVAAGQIALGAQHAAQTAVDQAAIGMTGGEADATEVVRSFFDGLRDPTMLGFHAVGIAREVGRFQRARADVKRINGLVDDLEKLWNANAEQFQAGAVRSIGQSSGDTHVYVPLDLLHEEIAKSGADPMTVMDQIYGDGGKSYAAALAAHDADMKIPVESLAQMKKLGLDKLIRTEGRFDPTLDGAQRLMEISKEFKDAFEEAIGQDPEKLPEDEKPLWEALKSFAGADEATGKRMLAEINALRTRHPELTTQEIFDAIYGPGGLDGPPLEAANEAAPGTHREVPAAVEPLIKPVEAPFTDKGWFAPFKEEQAKLDAEKAAQVAQEARRTSLKEAILKGLRKFMPEERVKAEEEARQDIRKDPVYRALHWFQKGELWGSAKGEDARLRIPEVDAAPAARAVDEARAALAEARTPEFDKLLEDQKKLPDLQKAADEGSRATGHADHAFRQAEADLELAYKLGTEKEGLTKGDLAFVRRKEILRDKAKKAWHEASDAWAAARAERDALVERITHAPGFHTYAERLAAAEKAVSDAEGTLKLAKEHSARAGQPLRLLDTEIDSLMGPGIAEQIKATKSGIVTSDPRQAIPVDAAANALGFPGSATMGDPARRMLAGLRDAVTEGQYVKHLADQRLRDRYGADLFENPQELLLSVLDAVHNEKSMGVVLRTYQAMGAKLDPLTRARSQMTKEMWEAAAEKLIQSKILKDTNPEVFARASMRAAEKTVAHLGKEGKERQAFDAAEATLLNHYLYRAARELQSDLGPKWGEINRNGASATVRKRLGLADPVTLNRDGSSRPAVYLDAHDHVLRAIGSMSEPDGYQADPAIVTKLIERVKDNAHDQWLSTLAWDPEVIQNVISEGKRWNRLTPEEAWQVHAMLTNLQHVGKMAAGESQAIRGMEIESAKRDLVAYLRGTTGEGPTQLEAPNLRMLDTLLERQQKEGGLKGILTYPFRLMDKAADMLGWSSDASMYAWNRTSELGPVGERIMEAFRERRNQRDAYLQEFFYPWMEIRKALDLDPKMAEEARGANLLLGLRSRADQTEVSHHWLLNMARWWGDADGRRHLGRAFGMTPGRVEESLTRFFTPEQMDKIQAEKDLIDQKMRPKLAAAHMQRTGVPLKEVEPAPFTLTWKQVDPVSGLQTEVRREYQGGYYPIHWDGRPGMAQSRVGDFANSGKMPRVPSEFLIERADTSSRTPDLNWAGMPQHMLRVAHNLAFGDFVQDSARVLLDRDVQKEIAAYRGDDAAKGLGQWLERVALDVSGGPDSTYAAADKNAKLRILRRALVRSTVSFNYPILFAHSAHPLGTGAARYGAGYVADYAGPAMADVLNGYTEHLVTGQNPVHDQALATFPELQHRASVLREEMGRWMLDREFHTTPTSALQKLVYAIDEHVIEGAGMAHLRFMDSAFATSTALARYRKAIDDGLSHEEAVKLGDKEVFETMPTYSQMEQPEVLADKHSLRSVGVIWHTYYGTWRGIWRDARYENVVRPGEESRAAKGFEPYASRALGEAEVFGRMMAGLGLGLVLGAYFKGSGPEENEKGSHWLLKRTLMAPAEVQPYAGALMERVVDMASGKKVRPMDFENTYLSPIAHTANAIGTFGDYRKTSEDRTMSLARAGAELAGFPKPLLNLGQFAYHGSEWWRRSPDGVAATSADFAAHVFYPYKWGRYSRFQGHNPFMDAASMLEDR